MTQLNKHTIVPLRAVMAWLVVLMLSTSATAKDSCLHDGADAAVPPVPLKEAMGEEAFNKAMASGKFRYVGNSKCRLCHRAFFIGRKKDPHDFAMDLLVKRGEENNPKCLACHTTGYGVDSGFVNMKETPRLANVQCEGCHGPGNIHMKYGKDKKPGGLLAGIDRPERIEKMCKTCHTQRWSGGKVHDFSREYDSYRFAQPKRVDQR